MCSSDLAPFVRMIPTVNKATGRIEFYAYSQGVSGEVFEGEVTGKHVRRVINKDASSDDTFDEYYDPKSLDIA